MDEPFVVELGDGRSARAVRVDGADDLADAVHELEVGGRPALVVVGGASGMSAIEGRAPSPPFPTTSSLRWRSGSA